MTHLLFRKNIITNIKTAINQFEDTTDINHPGMKGDIREITLKNIFKPLLPEGFNAETKGKVIDHYGHESKEIDIIIYSRNVLPPVLYGKKETLFPAEACFFVVEVKSKITAQGIKSAYKKAEYLKNTIKYLAGLYDEQDKPIEHIVSPIVPVLFAFSSDLSGRIKSELERYYEYDPNSKEDPCIRSICVLGKGCWTFNIQKKRWFFNPPNSDYDEVIDFLCLIINSLYKSLTSRLYPRLGKYLADPRRKSILL